MRDNFKNWRPPRFNKKGMTKWNWICQHYENLEMGKYSDIGAFTYINAKNGVEIGDYVEIGSHCSIYSVSTIDEKKGKVIIKKSAKIGTHSTVMPGVTIGENAVVGAYSFVKDNIPDNHLCFGVPAKIIRRLESHTSNTKD